MKGKITWKSGFILYMTMYRSITKPVRFKDITRTSIVSNIQNYTRISRKMSQMTQRRKKVENKEKGQTKEVNSGDKGFIGPRRKTGGKKPQ